MMPSIACTMVISFSCLYLNAQVAVSLDKMNVLFPSGADNFLTVAATDVPDSNLVLEPSMGDIKNISPGHYVWHICHRDTNIATLTIKDLRNQEVIAVKTYRVNRIPIPEPVLGSRNKHGSQPNGAFKYQGGLALLLKNFDFDLKCDVVHFHVQHLSKGMDSVVKKNTGARWNSEVQDLINRAVPGDAYIFYNIAYRCGCDPMIRYLSDDVVYKVK
jgi:hypothetical protein